MFELTLNNQPQTLRLQRACGFACSRPMTNGFLFEHTAGNSEQPKDLETNSFSDSTALQRYLISGRISLLMLRKLTGYVNNHQENHQGTGTPVAFSEFFSSK